MTTLRLCLDCRRPTPKTDGPRCPRCKLNRQRSIDADPGRRIRKLVLYGPGHRALRDAWRPLVHTGAVKCAHCSQPIAPGADWDLGHDPQGGMSMPWHATCNRADGAHIAHNNQGATR